MHTVRNIYERYQIFKISVQFLTVLLWLQTENTIIKHSGYLPLYNALGSQRYKNYVIK